MNETQQPSPDSKRRIELYVLKYREKTGTVAHPNAEIPESVITGLALNMDETGRPLCPCNFYPDGKKAEVERSREWICACDEMKIYKYCHCLLFVTPSGAPVTEYLPEEHEARKNYGVVLDPTPDKGRESSKKKEKVLDKKDGVD